MIDAAKLRSDCFKAWYRQQKIEERVAGGTTYPENQNLGGQCATHTKFVL